MPERLFWNEPEPTMLVYRQAQVLIARGWDPWEAMHHANRFWRKVDRTGEHWWWTEGKDKNGYGRWRIDGRSFAASRIAKLWTSPEGSGDGMHACHTCDLPLCVRPDHLFWGTKSENMLDMHRKGRGRAADRAFDAEVVAAIRAAYAAGGVSQTTLAKKFGVSQATISNVVSRRTKTYA